MQSKNFKKTPPIEEIYNSIYEMQAEFIEDVILKAILITIYLDSSIIMSLDSFPGHFFNNHSKDFFKSFNFINLPGYVF